MHTRHTNNLKYNKHVIKNCTYAAYLGICGTCSLNFNAHSLKSLKESILKFMLHVPEYTQISGSSINTKQLKYIFLLHVYYNPYQK